MKRINIYKGMMFGLTAAVTCALLFPAQGSVKAEYSPSKAAQQSSDAERVQPRATVKQAVDAAANINNVPGVIASAMKDSKRWAYASGEADLNDSTRPLKADNTFRIGSITKTVVATVVLQLVGEKKLSLDHTVEKWLPGLVQGNGYDGNKIKIRQLLNHTSGLANYTNGQFAKDLLEEPLREYTSEELVDRAIEMKPSFAPGAGWEYSNTGYVLLGLINEKITEDTYAEQIEERIVEPLKLNNTYMPEGLPFIPQQNARGYYYDDVTDKMIDLTYMSPSWADAAGDMISTAEDLNTFFQALLGGKLLKPEMLKEMLTTVDAGVGKYGLGITAWKLPNGVTIWGHTGGFHGFSSLAGGVEGGAHTIALNANVMSDPFKPNAAFNGLYKVMAEEFSANK